MSSNDITGDRLVSKAATDEYRNNYDKIFTDKPEKVEADNETKDESNDYTGN